MTIVNLSAAIARKPLYGSPCNGCGFCCMAEQCRLSVEAFGRRGTCPALELHGDRYACGLIVSAERYAAPGEAVELATACGKALGVGLGCDTLQNDADFEERDRIGDDLANRRAA